MATLNIDKGQGKGTYKMTTGIASLASGDTIVTKFNNIVSVQVTAAPTSGYAFAFVSGISGSTVTIGVYGAASGTAPSALTTAINVHYTVVGY